MNIEQSEKLAQVVSITSASAEKARFHLEANNWNVELAVSSVLDDHSSSNESSQQQQPASFSSAAAATSSSSQWSGASKSSSSRPRFATLNDIQKIQNEDNDEVDSTNTYFAGGEKSGVMIEGRPDQEKKKEKQASDLIKDILNQAAQSRSSQNGDEDDQMFVKKENKPKYFSGSGFTLASGSSSEQQQDSPHHDEEEDDSNEVVERRLTFWRNGFSVDDGPLMAYDDPKNQKYLELIKSGRAPTEILNVKYGQPVEVKVAHRSDEDYKPPPKQPIKPFSGSGYTLGGPSLSNQTSATISTLPGAFPSDPVSSSAATNSTATFEFKIDESLPTTSIQIRLADGTRLVSKFNHTHLVSDIRNFIRMSRPNESNPSFGLMTTFPNKVLENESLSVKDAGLLNAVIVQRYT